MLFTILKLAIALAAVLSTGYAVTRLWPAARRDPIYQSLALWFLIGTGTLSLLAFWASLIGTAYGLLTCTVAAALSLGYSAVALARSIHAGHLLQGPWRQQLKRRQPRNKSGFVRLVFAVVFLVQLLIMTFVTTIRAELGWDGVMNFGIKAKAFLLAGGVPLPYFADLSREWTHMNYPLFIPLLEAWVYRIMGALNERLIMVLFLGFFLSLVAIFYTSVRSRRSHLHSLGFTILLCTIPVSLTQSALAYADLPLAAFILGSSAFLYYWLHSKRPQDLLMAAVLAALCIWVKREGAVFWLLNLGAVSAWACLASGHSLARRLKALAIYLLPSAVLAPWVLFITSLGLPDTDFLPISVASVVSNLDRVPMIAGWLATDLSSVARWSILWWMFSLVIFVPSVRRFSSGEAYLALTAILYIGLLAFSYILSTWSPLVDHVYHSLDRIIFHVTPTAVFFMAVRLPDLEDWIKETLKVRSSSRSALAPLARPRQPAGK